jgi:hypothetical protein
MNTSLRVLNEAEIVQVSGGHGGLAKKITILGTLFFILELPHMIMGMVEFTNWVTDLYGSGCDADADHHGGHGHSHDHVGDYIKSYFCNAS